MQWRWFVRAVSQLLQRSACASGARQDALLPAGSCESYSESICEFFLYISSCPEAYLHSFPGGSGPKEKAGEALGSPKEPLGTPKEPPCSCSGNHGEGGAVQEGPKLTYGRAHREELALARLRGLMADSEADVRGVQAAHMDKVASVCRAHLGGQPYACCRAPRAAPSRPPCSGTTA